ncbi:cation:proton antiporter domain-containing protein [Streptacidiphilus sp. PAMC 29251]
MLLAGGGSAVGAAVAGLVGQIRRRTADPVLETVIALVTPYGAYVLAESAHASGVTAVVVAGVLLGRSGHRLSDARIRLQVEAVYAVVVFGLESVVFSIVGLELPTLVRELPGGSGDWPLQALAVALVLIALRVLWMLPLSATVQPDRGQSSWRVAGVVTWAGTRGVMPLAAALSIPLVAADGTPLPGRPLVLVLTTAVVVFTLVVQGLTLAGAVSRSGLAVEPEHSAQEEARTREALARAALAHLDQLNDLETVPAPALERARRNLDARLEQAVEQSAGLDGGLQGSPHGGAGGGAEAGAGGGGDGIPLLEAYRGLRRDIVARQGAELHRLYDAHQVSDTTRRRLQHDLDLEAAALGPR